MAVPLILKFSIKQARSIKDFKSTSYLIISKRWIALGKNIDVLQHQLDQAKKDIDQLMKLRSDGIENPEAFLADFRSGKLKFPKLQSIARVPDLDLSKYSRKTSRRGNSKYEQNLEFLLSMANELHRRTAAVPPVSNNDLIILFIIW